MQLLDDIVEIEDLTRRLEAYQAYLGAILEQQNEELIKAFIDHLSQVNVSLIFSKQLLLTLAQALPRLPFHMVVARYALPVLQPRIINFEEQVSVIREGLSDALAEGENWEEAADVLSGIPLSNAHRNLTSEYKLRKYIRLAMLYLEYGNGAMAEMCVNRAGPLLSEVRGVRDYRHLHLVFDSSFARILDHKGLFLEASRKYYDLVSATPDEAEQVEALSHAMTAAILGKAGPQRARLLATLYKDERCKSLPQYSLVEKMYLERLLGKAEVGAFAHTLLPRQRQLLVDGRTTHWDRAVMEHNLIAVSRLYNNIRFEDLGRLLGVDRENAEIISASMVQENRLEASIDQIEGLLSFQKGDESLLLTWDESIRNVCLMINEIIGQIS